MTAFSIDLRQRILDAYDAGEGARQQIADRFAVSLGFVKKLLAQRKATGNIAPRPHPGRPPAFSGETLKRLDEFVGQHADATLAEIQERFWQEVQCSIVAVHHTLRRLGYRRKKTLRASEQDRSDVKEQRDKWRGEHPFLNSERLVFLDESGAKTNMTRFRGRIKGGARLRDAAPAGHWATTTMISSIRLDGKTACMSVDGSTTSGVFREYVRQVLAPTLGRGDLVVMDNLSSHKDTQALRLIEEAGAEARFLPPYSPDFNPMEDMWSKVKESLRSAKARARHARPSNRNCPPGDLRRRCSRLVQGMWIRNILNCSRSCKPLNGSASQPWAVI